VWTLDQQAAYVKQGIWPIAGLQPNYIEDVFSTWLVTPTLSNTTYSVTNGIDVSGKGGMVWMKSRSAAGNNLLYDTARGASAGSNNALISNNTSGQQTANFDYITGLSNGFTVNFATGGGQLTNNGINYASWTFREQAKFFDVVTYTGNSTNRTIAHNLGSVPGCIIVKRTDSAGGSWAVYHRSLGATKYIILNSTALSGTYSGYWNDTEPTSSVFSVGGVSGEVNATGGTYVAYLFAHNAGGFGPTDLDNVISCGSFTTDSGGAMSVNLGYEPQWLMYKASSGGAGFSNWVIRDTMRGWVTDVGGTSTRAYLAANSSNSENDFAGANGIGVRSTGFQSTEGSELQGDATYIYIAIRRGPMKVPTTGTSVFALDTLGGTSPNPPGFNGVLVDWAWKRVRNTSDDWYSQSRLTGTNEFKLNATDAATDVSNIEFDYQDGWLDSASSLSTQLSWMFKRAPSFMDVVCYTGTGVARTVAHNLAAVPELMIVKRRNATNNWAVYAATLGNTNRVFINQTQASAADSTLWNDTTPTSTVFTVGTAFATNNTGDTYVAYLFATCPGVSKVGSYTGTGALQTINCGFTSGARFILIKRTDTTGDWWTYNSLRGITSGNDPYMLVNSTAAEVGGTNYVDTTGVGFQVTAAAPAGLNASGGTYIFLAIA
jgi:hypothetical protein